MKSTTKGIIFDMDNTLLRSNIDFKAMKKETYQFLCSHGFLANDLILSEHTTSTVIEKAMRTKLMTSEQVREMWEIPKKYEIEGMQEAVLEAGVEELLSQIHQKYCLVVVTNNSVDAAKTTLRENGISEYFDCLVGREMVSSLKPSPDGFFYVLDQYQNIKANEWITVGDAWIDGKASTDAGIKFISYQGDSEKLHRMGVHPVAEIMDIRELIHFI